MTVIGEPKWTDEEIALALQAAASKHASQSMASVAREVAAQINRTAKSVEQRLCRLLASPELRQRRALAERARYAKRVEKYKPYEAYQVVHRPTQEMLADHAARCAAPVRDLTAALCGDPPVGYSALERRA